VRPPHYFVAAMDLELLIRTSGFAVVFAAMALWEVASPRRLLAIGRGARWASNLGILLVDVLAVRILIPTAATGAALFAAGRGWGAVASRGIAALGRRRARLPRARSRALRPARAVSQGAGAVAIAPHASRRSRRRRLEQARKSTWSRLHSPRTIAGVWQMRMLPLALGLTLLALLSPSGPSGAPSFIGAAMGQTPEALYLKCRKAVFKKYGRRGTRYGSKKLLMPSTTATQSVDQCVANGGRMM
jgi:hypothetical protein